MNQRIQKLIDELNQEEAELLAQLKEVRDARSRLNTSATTPSKNATKNVLSTRPTWSELTKSALANLGGKGTAPQIAKYISAVSPDLNEDHVLSTVRYVLSNDKGFQITEEKEGRASFYKLKKAS